MRAPWHVILVFARFISHSSNRLPPLFCCLPQSRPTISALWYLLPCCCIFTNPSILSIRTVAFPMALAHIANCVAVQVCPRAYRSSPECESQCIHHGRYCTPDPDGDLDNGYKGKDVVQVSLEIVHCPSQRLNKLAQHDQVQAKDCSQSAQPRFEGQCGVHKYMKTRICLWWLSQSASKPFHRTRNSPSKRITNGEGTVIIKALIFEQAMYGIAHFQTPSALSHTLLSYPDVRAGSFTESQENKSEPVTLL